MGSTLYSVSRCDAGEEQLTPEDTSGTEKRDPGLSWHDAPRFALLIRDLRSSACSYCFAHEILMADPELESLKHALAAAQGRIGEERQRAEQEKERAEQERRRAEQERERAETADQRAETAEKLTKKTSFTEFVRLCHQNFTAPLHMEHNRRLTTKGFLTSPRQKKHPKFLRPWEDFPQTHLQYFNTAYRVLCQDNNNSYFSPRLVLEAKGQAACAHALIREKDLEHYD